MISMPQSRKLTVRELFVVNLVVPVPVSITNHHSSYFISHRLATFLHGTPEFPCRNEAIAVAIQGLKIFGEAGAEAVVTEMKQLHDRGVIQPKLANMLTREEKRASLQYLMFLKKKRCGRISLIMRRVTMKPP